MRFPSNIPGLQGHHWSNAIAMATPIAHKGVTAGAKVLARTALELFATPALVDSAWAYFNTVQSEDAPPYTSFLSEEDPPPIHLNREIMDRYRPALKAYYYDPTKYDTYLEQLGITYPTIREKKEETSSSGG